MDPLPKPKIDPAAPLVQRLSGEPSAPLETVHWHPGLRRLLAYWQQRCGGGSLPRRADIEPAGIGVALLPYVALLKRDPVGGRMVYSLVGTGVVRVREGLTPQDPTGFFLDEAPHHVSQEWILAGPTRAAIERRPIYDRGEYALTAERSGRYERLCLPLSEDGEAVDRLLVGFFAS